MSRQKTLFEETLSLLIENIMPNVVLSLKELGMTYVHTGILAEHSLAFLKYINLEFPFDIPNLPTITDESGAEKRVVIFNLNNKGVVSLAQGIRTNEFGTTSLVGEIVISDDYVKLFENIFLENSCLFSLSKDLTKRALELERDKELVKDLLKTMQGILPKITRNVLTEKK